VARRAVPLHLQSFLLNLGWALLSLEIVPKILYTDRLWWILAYRSVNIALTELDRVRVCSDVVQFSSVSAMWTLVRLMNYSNQRGQRHVTFSFPK